MNKDFHFVLLIPHRDMAGPLRTLSRFLFASGLPGAWSFPQAAPLALVKRPLSPAALQSLASNLRSAAQDSAGGKINLGPPELVPCPLFHGFFGPTLDLSPPPLPYPGVLYPFPRIVLCTGVVARGDAVLLTDIPDIPPVSPAFFRAAMVANMTIRPLIPEPPENYSFTWRIGKPRWLPSYRKPRVADPKG
ncbi:hypothetical protein AGMMS49940_16650 [Spirochaetia bacterium]|nr:hypothetical protein AGMMS49940_16650 [Spirochaetia bacterium]